MLGFILALLALPAMAVLVLMVKIWIWKNFL